MKFGQKMVQLVDLRPGWILKAPSFPSKSFNLIPKLSKPLRSAFNQKMLKRAKSTAVVNKLNLSTEEKKEAKAHNTLLQSEIIDKLKIPKKSKNGEIDQNEKELLEKIVMRYQKIFLAIHKDQKMSQDLKYSLLKKCRSTYIKHLLKRIFDLRNDSDPKNHLKGGHLILSVALLHLRSNWGGSTIELIKTLSYLKIHPEALLTRLPDGEYNYTNLSLPFLMFKETFPEDYQNEEDYTHEYKRGVMRLKTLFEMLIEGSEGLFRSQKNLRNSFSLITAICGIRPLVDEEVKVLIEGELRLIAERHLRSQVDFFEFMKAHIQIEFKQDTKLLERIEGKFLGLYKKRSDTLDPRILTDRNLRVVFANSKNFEKKFPRAFRFYCSELSKDESISIEAYFQLVKNSRLLENCSPILSDIFFQKIVAHLINNGSFQEVERTTELLYRTAKAKMLSFDNRETLNRALIKIYKANKKKENLDYNIVNMFLRTQLILRYFDSPEIAALADLIYHQNQREEISRLGRNVVDSCLNLFISFSRSSVKYNHPIFQKLCFQIVSHPKSEESLGYLESFKVFISALHNIYCKAIFDGIDEIPSKKMTFAEVDEVVMRRAKENVPEYVSKLLLMHLNRVLRVVTEERYVNTFQRNQDGEEVSYDVKHKLINVLLTLRYTGFFSEDKLETWDRVIKHAIEQLNELFDGCSEGEVELHAEEYIKPPREEAEEKELNLIIPRFIEKKQSDKEDKIYQELRRRDGVEVRREVRRLIYDIDFELTLSGFEGGEKAREVQEGLEDENGGLDGAGSGPRVVYLEHDGLYHFSRVGRVRCLTDKVNRFQLIKSGVELYQTVFDQGSAPQEAIDLVLKEIRRKPPNNRNTQLEETTEPK